jgi:hypothetical protein
LLGRLAEAQTVLAENAQKQPAYAGTMTLLAEIERALNSFIVELKACAAGASEASPAKSS